MELGNSSHVVVLGRSVGVAGAGRCGAGVRAVVLVHTHPDNTGTRVATRVRSRAQCAADSRHVIRGSWADTSLAWSRGGPLRVIFVMGRGQEDTSEVSRGQEDTSEVSRALQLHG